LKATGFNPCAYEVMKTRFQALLSNGSTCAATDGMDVTGGGDGKKSELIDRLLTREFGAAAVRDFDGGMLTWTVLLVIDCYFDHTPH
jgi:hypothetical protein